MLFLLFSAVLAHNAEQWRHRVVYQFMTDRFARTNDSQDPICVLENQRYCGGSYRGVINHIDYIANLGVDAVWISPIHHNADSADGDGYHGYWATSLTEVNERFGTKEDLIEMIDKFHERDIWVMGDVVANHMGWTNSWDNISQFDPFNDPSHYHDCGYCLYDPVDNPDCWVQDYQNETQVLYCRLYGLPDLNQTVPMVNETLLNWINETIRNYSIDGLRIDTVPYVFKWFWSNFTYFANVYTMGEVADGRIDYVAGFQGYVDGLLNFPMFYALLNVFKSNYPMTTLSTTWRRETGADYYLPCNNNTDNSSDSYYDSFYDERVNVRSTPGYGNDTDSSGSGYFSDIGLLGNFIENHDFGRFLDQYPYYNMYRNALVWVIGAEGIPILYYGAEQGYNGGTQPYCREPLWSSEFKEEGSFQGLYEWHQKFLRFRKASGFSYFPQTEIFSRTDMYVFARGDIIFLMTNAKDNPRVTATLSKLPWRPGTVVCDILGNGSDCLTLSNSLTLDVELINAEPKVYSPRDWNFQDEDFTDVNVNIFIALICLFAVFAVVACWRVYIILKQSRVRLRKGQYSRITEESTRVNGWKRAY